MTHTGFAQTLRHFDRHNVNVRKSLVNEVLPEHFRDDYPMLIEFLDAYYEFLDSADNFGGIIEELQTIRDIEDTKLSFLDLLFDEIGLGISNGQFTTPREVIRNFGNFFRVKGSEYSIHGFFRAFFNETVEIFHPKDSLFIVGESNIGSEDAKRIQDGRLFQVFSTLIKGPIPLLEWEAMYRNYVHPSGFYLGAAVVLEAEPALNISTLTSIPFVNPNINVFGVSPEFSYAAEGETVGAIRTSLFAPSYDGLDSDQINLDALRYVQHGYVNINYAGKGFETFPMRDRFDLNRKLSQWQNMTIAEIENYYSNMGEFAGFKIRFDEFADSTGVTSNGIVNSAVRFSSTNDKFSQREYIVGTK